MTSDQFRGAVPLDGNSGGGMGVSCIWHSHDLEHPPDAPACAMATNPATGAPIRAIPLPALLAWLTVNLTQMLAITEAMATHLGEISAYVEALEARDDNAS